MVEDSGDVGVEEALPGDGGAEWAGEEVEEGSEQEGKFWWSHTDMKVCFYGLQLFLDYGRTNIFFDITKVDCVPS